MHLPFHVPMGCVWFLLVGHFIFENCFDSVCHISFKQHLPEDGHNGWMNNVRGYTAYNTINLHTCICICWFHFSLWHFATFYTQICEPIWETSHCKRLITWSANIIWVTLNNTSFLFYHIFNLMALIGILFIYGKFLRGSFVHSAIKFVQSLLTLSTVNH
jgi:hypothetical protein